MRQYVGGETNALYLEFVLFLIPYLIAGYDVLLKAARNIGNGQVFDENFLMTIATGGRICPGTVSRFSASYGRGCSGNALLSGG